LARAAIATARCRVPAPRRAAQSLGAASGHRYNRRFLQGRDDTAAADSQSPRHAGGAQFNRYFKSAA
jgi:hypothetical protein